MISKSLATFRPQAYQRRADCQRPSSSGHALAVKGFKATAHYDTIISEHLSKT